MLILGLLLLACTAAFTALAISGNLSGGAEHSVSILGNHIATMNGLAIFCAGLALGLIFSLGCLMAFAGGLLHRHKGRKYRAMRRDAAVTARQRDDLASRLDETRAANTADPGGRTDTADADYAHAGGGAARAETEPGRSRRHHARHLFGH